MSRQVKFYLSVQDEQGSQAEKQAILSTLAQEMEAYDAEISTLSSETSVPGMAVKGDETSGILDIKIDLDALRSLGKWIYQRLTPGVKVKFKHHEAEFEFEGRNTDELDAAMKKFENFVNSLAESQ